MEGVAALMKTKALFLILLIIIVSGWLTTGCNTDALTPEPAGYEDNGTILSVRTGEKYFEVYNGEKWSELTVKGVNIGTSLPGRWYTQFPASRELYRNWLVEIAAMNANTVRLYTLLDPAFYAVFFEYNNNPENEPLWLIQEIWPHDEVPGLNFHDQNYRTTYLEEITLVIDALHGNADIPSRPYRAYGNYSVDVSPYLLGVLIGRELEPEEVTATNQANPGLNSFTGDYVLAGAGSSPTEAWLAEMCDRVMQHSQRAYNRQYPVGFVSWPTLDPLTHPTEWEADGTPGYNDREVVDPRIFVIGPLNKAGFFGAYHIYPNYPDFMNNEPSFAEYEDEEGTFRYKGYLNQFISIHPPYPALVAEFGISTSLNTAHLNPDGLHHGSLSEKEQGALIVRMMRSILEENYAGGIIFEWTDEWAKKTWNSEPFMVPWERQVLWQNAMCPEQNYGILAVKPEKRHAESLYQTWLDISFEDVFNRLGANSDSFGKISSIELGADEAFFYIAVTVNTGESGQENAFPWDELGLTVGIDTGFREAGEFLLPLTGLPELPTGVVFLLHIASPEEAELLAVPSYNRGELAFAPRPSSGANFTRIETLVNRERITADGRIFPALYTDESRLNYGRFNPDDPDYNSTAHWYVETETNRIIVRLPWMLLNVSDPSKGSILYDSGIYTGLPERDELGYQQTEGFFLYTATYSKTGTSGKLNDRPLVIDFEPRLDDSFNETIEPFLWPGWEEPLYQFRLKESYHIIAEYFSLVE